MEQEDRTFYIAIIVACIVGIAIVANSIVSSPKYEEHYTELYFYGEKIAEGADLVYWEGYSATVGESGIFLETGAIQMGPLHVGDTVEKDGISWNVEDASSDTGEVLMRAVPSEGTGGSDVTMLVVVANHRGADLAYGCTVSTAKGTQDCTITVSDGQEAITAVTVQVPSPPEAGEPIDEYDEVFQTYVRHVEDYGEFRLVTIENESGLHDPYWRTRVSVTLQTGNTIYFWIRLDDE